MESLAKPLRTSMTGYASRTSLLVGLFLGVALLYVAVPKSAVVPRYEELALGQKTKVLFGAVDGVRVHCQDLNDLDECLKGYAMQAHGSPVVLWLGNSQLHAINHYRQGEETAAPDLHRRFRDWGIYFLALSQPNANLQEHHLLLAHLLDRLRVDTLVLPVVFDDMREDGIRASLSGARKTHMQEAERKRTTAGQERLAPRGDRDARTNDMAALTNTFQERSERFLNQKLEQFWALWAKRPELRGEFFLSLFQFRNWVLGIDPSSTRKMIPGRYAKNRDALAAILDLAAARGIPVLVYVVPLRNDIKVPYDPDEYAVFKREVAALVARPDVRFADLENLVPPEFWGRITTVLGGEDLDFMHFQAAGHRLLAASLYSELMALWSAGSEAEAGQ